jgi:error-prone DNA polymerase
MAERGYDPAFAEQVFEQIKGFGSYGFPESHAASFALIVYVSCWLKCHEPAAFCCAMLNSQPLGFYSPDQLVQDARRHGIAVRPVDVRHADWDCTLEEAGVPRGDGLLHVPAIRLGLRQIAGLREDVARRVVAARAQSPFADVADLCARAGLDDRAQALLADAGALKGLAGHRHRARWAIEGVEKQLPLFGAVPERAVQLPVPSAHDDMQADYASIGLTLGRHPLAMLRKALAARRCRRSREFAGLAHGTPVRLAGLVTLRQRPETASGVTFVTLEDEDGLVNVVVWRDLGERQRRVLLEARLLAVQGRVESAEGVQHLIAADLRDWSAMLGNLATQSRDFR